MAVGEPAIKSSRMYWLRWSSKVVTISYHHFTTHLGPWQVRQMSAGSFDRRIATEGPVMAALPGAVERWQGEEVEKLHLTVLENRWHNPYILVQKDPLLTYLLVSVPSVLTLRYLVPGWTNPIWKIFLTPRYLVGGWTNMLVKMGSSSPIIGVQIKHIWVATTLKLLYMIYDMYKMRWIYFFSCSLHVWYTFVHKWCTVYIL